MKDQPREGNTYVLQGVKVSKERWDAHYATYSKKREAAKNGGKLGQKKGGERMKLDANMNLADFAKIFHGVNLSSYQVKLLREIDKSDIVKRIRSGQFGSKDPDGNHFAGSGS